MLNYRSNCLTHLLCHLFTLLFSTKPKKSGYFLQTFLLAKTLFLILSNFAFLPAILLAIYCRLFTEALIYMATMSFSIFYHACDQVKGSALNSDVQQDFHASHIFAYKDDYNSQVTQQLAAVFKTALESTNSLI